MAKTANSVLADRLGAFMSQLPPALAAKLGAALEHARATGASDLPYEVLLNAVATRDRRKRGADPVRMFCLPFENMLVNVRAQEQLSPEIARSSIMPVWSWLENELLPDALVDMGRKLVDYAKRDDRVAHEGLQAILYATCASAIFDAFKVLRTDSKARQRLEQKLGGEAVIDDARKMAEALSVAPSLQKIAASLPRRIEVFEPAMIAEVEQVYKSAEENSPYAIYVAWDVMRRLAQPWQILRLAKKIAGAGKESRLEQSALHEIGEAFLRDLETIVSGFETKRRAGVDPDTMLVRLNQFVDVSKGVIAEIDIRRCSDWGQRILAARGRLCSALSDETSRFEHDVIRALPLTQMGTFGKNGPKKVDVDNAPNPEYVAQAKAALRLLKGACAAAESIGLQAHCRIVTQQIDAHLASYEDRLLDEIRHSRGEERKNAEAYLALVIEFHEEMGAATMAETLRRRGKTAASGN